MIKELALEIINNLPDDASMADIVEALYVQMNIAKGSKNNREVI